MIRKAQKIVLGLLVILATGCATPDRIKFSSLEGGSESVTINDFRTNINNFTTASNKGSGRETILGDDAIDPTPPILLKQYIAHSGKIIVFPLEVKLELFTVKYFEPDVYVDQSSFDVATQSVPGSDPLSATLAMFLIQGIEGMSSSRIIEVHIAGSVKGKRFTGYGHNQTKGSISEEDIKEAISEALADSVSKISEVLTSGEVSNKQLHRTLKSAPVN